MPRFSLFPTVILLTTTSLAQAQMAPPQVPGPVTTTPGWQLDLGGQIRPRVMVHTGKDFVADSETREAVTQRSRVTARATHETGLGATIQIQDVRVWGEEADTLDFNAEGLDVHQAFGTIPIIDGLALRLGRQEVVFDGARLIGNLDWAQRARAFDGGRRTRGEHKRKTNRQMSHKAFS
jgi:hypothetical protein